MIIGREAGGAAAETDLVPYLFVVDGPFQGVLCYKSVHVARFCLAVPVDPTHSLGVVAGIPGHVHDDDPGKEGVGETWCCHGDLGCGNCGEYDFG